MNKIEQEAEKEARQNARGWLEVQQTCSHDSFLKGVKWAKIHIHNAALSEAIEKISNCGLSRYENEYVEILEGLKIKP